jgi:streptogramin lyase
VAAVLAVSSPASQAKKAKPFPEVIQLPTGFRPEGIEVGRGTTFYTGSVANGAIFRGDLRTGRGTVIIAGATGLAATGIELDRHKRLWVAGAGTGTARVYDVRTGALLRTYQLGTPPATFINDVVVTTQGGVLHRLAAAGSVPRPDRAARRPRERPDNPARR